jgi:hypothetical protein
VHCSQVCFFHPSIKGADGRMLLLPPLIPYMRHNLAAARSAPAGTPSLPASATQ